jgi:uncharacterized protein
MVSQSGSVGQHGHGSGVQWREWNDDTFRRARELDRPILLDISAVWCHWCHVMDQTSYADPAVVDLIDQYYVPVRVDNDRRPDVNERYNMGGWPTTAFLTPTGDVLTGATYIPPEQMRRILVQVAEYYRTNKQEITAKLSQRPPTPVQPSGTPGVQVDRATVANVLQSVHDSFDQAHGGFGDEPKFPHPDAIELALRDDQDSGNTTSLTVVVKTLDAMAGGGLYDPIEGGFFRYSTTRDWSIPHFEKMLEGNAGLLTNYLRACQVTGNSRYAEVARDIMRYLNTVLSEQAQGGFYGSQDADEQYYSLALDERRKRPTPFVDHTLYVDWNAMMASAYLLAGAVLADQNVQDFALRTLARLWQTCHHARQGMCHFYDGQPQMPGLLSDQVHMGVALLDAYQATGDPVYLDHAEELATFCAQSLAAAGGGFYDRVEDPDALGNLRTPLVPLPANAVAARFLLRLFWLTGKQDYGDMAQRTLLRFAPTYARMGYFAAPYALAVDEALRPPVKVVIVGAVGDERLRALHTTARSLAEPWKIIQILDPQRDAEAFGRSGFPVPAEPLAYPCLGTTCLAPLNDPAALAAFARVAGKRREGDGETRGGRDAETRGGEDAEMGRYGEVE